MVSIYFSLYWFKGWIRTVEEYVFSDLTYSVNKVLLVTSLTHEV